MSNLSISLIGPPIVAVDEQSIDVDTRKAIALVAYLALHPGTQTRDSLATLLWPDLNQQRARAALRRTLSTLNQSALAPWLDVSRSAIGLGDGPSRHIDVTDFRDLISSCDGHGHGETDACPRCISPLLKAVALVRGDFLAGFTLRDSVNFDDWQFFTAEALRHDYVRALDRLVSALVMAGQFDAAIEHMRSRLQVDPLHEAAHRQLMRLFVWSDQRNAALRQYRECVRILDEELGVPPLDETTDLYETIYSNGVLARPIAPVHSANDVVPANVAVGVEPPILPSFIGRDQAWQVLMDALGSADNGALVFVTGEAGIGKTALLTHFLDAAAKQGHPILSAQCFQEESDLAYAPLRDLLRASLALPIAEQLSTLPAPWIAEAARLVPELAQTTLPVEVPGLEDGAAKGRFFEAIYQVFRQLAATSRPCCIAVDNLHWADNATLELLGYLARRLYGQGICLILTWRTDEATADGLRRWVDASVVREAATFDIPLERLTSTDIKMLVDGSSLVQSQQSDELASRLQDISAGIPLFIIEYLSLLQQVPTLLNEKEWSLPEGIRNLLRSRLDPIDEAGQQLLTAAAVLGRSFDYDILRGVSGRSDDECVLALEQLLRHRLLRELDDGSYDFYHDQLRSLVYEETSRARRRLLHRRVVDGLSRTARRRDPALAATLAYHCTKGDLPDQAVTAYLDAAQQAIAVYANVEAIDYLEHALALGADETAAIHEQLGDLRVLLGEYNRALNDFEVAAAHVTVAESARLEGKIGDIYHRLGNLSLASRHFETALADRSLESSWRCRFLAKASLVAAQSGDQDDARELAQAALEVAATLADPLALAVSHNLLSILARHAENAAEAVAQAKRSLAYAEESESQAARVAALNNLAMAHAADGAYGEAISLSQEALATSIALGDRHHAAALHNHLADYHHALGDESQANAQIKQAVQLFAEISADGLDLNPGIWKLVEW